MMFEDQIARNKRLTFLIIFLFSLFIVGLGFVFGYVLASSRSRDPSVARTTAIEVGMQNSGLGAVLAQAHFANPLTAIPSAISAITHCIIGSACAAWWSRRPPEESAIGLSS